MSTAALRLDRSSLCVKTLAVTERLVAEHTSQRSCSAWALLVVTTGEETAGRHPWASSRCSQSVCSSIQTVCRRPPHERPTQGRAALDAAAASGAVPHLQEEALAHVRVYPSPEYVVERIRTALEAGAQTPAGEHDLEGLLDAVPYPATA